MSGLLLDLLPAGLRREREDERRDLNKATRRSREREKDTFSYILEAPGNKRSRTTRTGLSSSSGLNDGFRFSRKLRTPSLKSAFSLVKLCFMSSDGCRGEFVDRVESSRTEGSQYRAGRGAEGGGGGA